MQVAVQHNLRNQRGTTVTQEFVGTTTAIRAVLSLNADSSTNVYCLVVPKSIRAPHIWKKTRFWGPSFTWSEPSRLGRRAVWWRWPHFPIAGVRYGFDIIDENAVISPVTLPNHPSTRPHSELFEKATKQVVNEIQCGNYVVCDPPPKIVSPMAAIPKPDGGVRLIHDCSRPPGLSVNDYNSADWQQKFARIDDAANLITQGCFFAKVDLKNAYRSVKLSKQSQEATGLSWEVDGKTVFMKDTRLPFGASRSPGIFHRLT